MSKCLSISHYHVFCILKYEPWPQGWKTHDIEGRVKKTWSLWQVRKQQIRLEGRREEEKETRWEESGQEQGTGVRMTVCNTWRKELRCIENRRIRDEQFKEMRQDKRRGEARGGDVSFLQLTATGLRVCLLDYTLLPLKIHVHTLLYTAWVFAFLSPPKTCHSWECFKCIFITLTVDYTKKIPPFIKASVWWKKKISRWSILVCNLCCECDMFFIGDFTTAKHRAVSQF